MNEPNQTLAVEKATAASISMIEIVARAATDPTVDVAKMERLYAMAKEEREWNAERAFNEAMRKAQSSMPVIPKDAENRSTNSRFAQLETLKKRALPIITENGFAMQFSQGGGAPPGKIRVKCKVSHDGGHSEIHFLDLSPDDTGMKGLKNKTGIHGEGSTFTYGERYLTKLIFNITIVGEDDDGNHGNKPRPQGASSLGGAVDDRANKRKMVDLTRDVSGVEGYALTEEDKEIITQHLIDECFISPDETLATLAGKRLAEVVAKLEARK
jgi:hypothetical protein